MAVMTPKIVDRLWEKGIIRQLDGKKPIIYGTKNNDEISAYTTTGKIDINKKVLYTVTGVWYKHVLSDFVKYGVTYIGGEGNDTIEGTGYSDILKGNSGSDTLSGRGGYDRLEGGVGFDTYYIEGINSIFDEDGKGKLIFGSKEKNLGKLINFEQTDLTAQNEIEAIWKSTDEQEKKNNKFTAYRIKNDLLIQQDGSNNAVNVNNYFQQATSGGEGNWSGVLDIQLHAKKGTPDGKGIAVEVAGKPYGYNVFNLAGGTKYSYFVTGGSKTDYLSAGSAVPGYSGFAVDAKLQGGNDIANGTPRRDRIDGGEGTDLVFGSRPFFKYKTQEDKDLDNDVLIGNDGGDFIHGMAGDDVIHAGKESDHLVETPASGQGDWVTGGEGNDQIFGSPAQDMLQGGEGTDIIHAGANNDLVLGDANIRPGVRTRTSQVGENASTEFNYDLEKQEQMPLVTQMHLNEETARWSWTINNEKNAYTIFYRGNIEDKVKYDQYEPLVAQGGAADFLHGGAGDDMIIGQTGDDVLHGESGDDALVGDDTRDQSVTGDDHLHGGTGSDTLIGGKGADSYYFTSDEMKPEAGKPAPVDTIIDDGLGNGSQPDTIYLNTRRIADYTWSFDRAAQRWSSNDGWQIVKYGNALKISYQGQPGSILVQDYADGDYGLKLPGFPSSATEPGNNDPKPQPPGPVRPVPDQPKAPTAGKPLAAQSIHEKDKLTYTLAEDTFHTANQDDKLSYSARLADGKPLPKWLNFDAATRTFSGTPGNDDVGTLDIEISVQGKGGSASQHLALNVINVNDAPQAGQKLPVQQVEHSRLFYYQLPENAFKDIDKDDKLTFSATGENGQPLPGWLKFDTYNARFTGSPSANTPRGNYRVTVTATDSGGLKAHQTLELNLTQGMPLKPVNGTDRNDVLTSTADNELLAGGGGKDVYQFARGFGHDLINNHDENSNQDDVVAFTNMNRKDFMIMRDNISLYLRSISGADELRIMGQFLSNTKWRIGEIRFADGSVLTADEIERELRKTTEGDDYIYGSKGNDIINGKGGNDVISGEEGDDELYGEDGNDDLVGSAGNDKLSGGAGDDSLNGGEGRDHLSGGAGNDELVGGEGDDQLHGNEGDDKLYGGTGNDLLIGGSGNDTLSGSAGNDIYRFARGFGHDVINNYDAGLGRHDSIDFSDINRSDVDIRREGGNLVLRSKDGKDQITVTNHFFNGWQIDSIRFADGTTLDHDAINSLANTRNAPRGNYMEPAAQALQMNQAIASLNGQAQPLDALATPDLQPRPLLAAGNP